MHYIFSGWLGLVEFWFPPKPNHRRPDLMFIPSVQGACASTDSFASDSDSNTDNTGPAALIPTPPPRRCEQEPVRHLLFGSLSAVQSTIRLLYRLNYAEPNDWSQPISTGRANEVMAILTRRVRPGSSG